jgi:ubiquinone/menaquinone biosynthesis C-methylase UbiE
MIHALFRKASALSGKALLKHWAKKATDYSTDYEVLDPARPPSRLDGWHEAPVAERQHAAYQPLLAQMYAGQPRRDFEVAAEAVRATGLADAVLLEVGCGSGYYSEVFAHLLGRPVRYTGLDYSRAMIDLARVRYPGHRFVEGDATALPFPDRSFDIVLNGVSLMHIQKYPAAITEAARVARSWCVFHTVPVLRHRPTAFIRKKAYGGPSIEVIFNRDELLGLFRGNGLAVQQVWKSIPYDLEAVLGEPTETETFACRREG